MVTIQRDGVQHFDPAKIITGAGVRVSDLSIDNALAELLGAIATTPQSADAMDSNLTGSMFAALASADGSTVVKTAASLAVICKLATQHFDPAKIITGAGVRVSDLSIDNALAELLGAIATTPQSADAMDSNLTGSMFAALTSADGSTVVKTAASLAVICKLATERLWPATSADGVPRGGMRHLDGLLLLPARQGLHPASPGPQQQSQHPPTPPPPQDTEDSMLGKRPRDEPTDTNDSDTSGAGATLLTTITPARQVRLISIFLHVAAHEI